MKINNLTINITDISDALALGNSSIVEEILAIGESIIKQGGTIIIQRQYQNATPELLAHFSTVEEVKDWKKQLNNSQLTLNKPPIE